MKKSAHYLSLLFVLFILSACGPKSGVITGEQAQTMGKKLKDVGQDICSEFPADFVHSATGKTIVKVEPSKIPSVFSCKYYTEYSDDYYKQGDAKLPGGPSISIVLDNLSVETQKKGIALMDGSVETDPRIKMDHYIAKRENGSIWQVSLVINPNRYVWTDYSGKALTDDELINFASKIAEKIQGNSSLKIEANPVAISEEATEAKPESQEAKAKSFFDLIGSNKIDDALKMMDGNENTKQMWGVNFNSIDSLVIKTIEPVYEEESTSTRVTYKVVLEAKVKTDQYGWSNGQNTRWITLQNDNGEWMIHELANNP